MTDIDPDNPARKTNQTAASKAERRQQRLAAQLRENLKKRKDLSRAKAKDNSTRINDDVTAVESDQDGDII